jgi:hypothetical protein
MGFFRGLIFVLALAVAGAGCGGDNGGGATGGSGGSGDGGSGGSGDGGSGGGNGGTEVDSDEALRGMMDAIALDLGKVLGEIAPADVVAAEKQGDPDYSTMCPAGGTGAWTQSPGIGQGGTLSLADCTLPTGCEMPTECITLNGELAGFLELDPDEPGLLRQVHAIMLRSLEPLEISGAYRAGLMVERFDLSAEVPDPTDFTTYWEITATTPLLQTICAWSGGAGCAPSPF